MFLWQDKLISSLDRVKNEKTGDNQKTAVIWLTHGLNHSLKNEAKQNFSKVINEFIYMFIYVKEKQTNCMCQVKSTEG